MECPLSGKISYTKKDAQTYVNAHPDKRLRAYECKCGKWHLTSRSFIENMQQEFVRRPLKMARKFKKYIQK